MISSIMMLSACGGGGGGSSDGVADTDEVADTTAPTVFHGPQVNAPRNQVTAVFSEPMDAATINTSTFTLEENSGVAVAGGVSYSGVTAIFTPVALLASSATYTATITTAARDLSGNSAANDFSWTFTTAAGDIQISWDGNSETAVNRPGGGYKVYYSANSGFNPGDGGVTEIDVPYSSGLSAPTSVLIQLSPGVYYMRVIAYSALSPPGASSGSTSTVSPEITLIAP